MKFLAMHITNQKLSFYIFMVGNLQNILMEHDLYLMSMIFGKKKRKIYNFDPYTVFLAIATNIPQRLKAGFVVQGHIVSLRINFSSYYLLKQHFCQHKKHFS